MHSLLRQALAPDKWSLSCSVSLQSFVEDCADGAYARARFSLATATVQIKKKWTKWSPLQLGDASVVVMERTTTFGVVGAVVAAAGPEIRSAILVPPPKRSRV